VKAVEEIKRLKDSLENQNPTILLKTIQTLSNQLHEREQTIEALKQEAATTEQKQNELLTQYENEVKALQDFIDTNIDKIELEPKVKSATNAPFVNNEKYKEIHKADKVTIKQLKDANAVLNRRVSEFEAVIVDLTKKLEGNVTWQLNRDPKVDTLTQIEQTVSVKATVTQSAYNTMKNQLLQEIEQYKSVIEAQSATIETLKKVSNSGTIGTEVLDLSKQIQSSKAREATLIQRINVLLHDDIFLPLYSHLSKLSRTLMPSMLITTK
jgi:hypothetical protein